MRLLAQSPLRYRRQILALKHFFAGRRCTVVLLDDLSSHGDDLQLHSIVHGVIDLEQLALDYGAERRRLRVVKMRGRKFRGGYHDFTIETGGLKVFPRLVAAEHHKPFIGEYCSSGNAELDALIGGGLERGTSALLIGGAGVGKSSITLTYAVAAAERGESATIFAFDEGLGTIFARAEGFGIPLQKHVESGQIVVRQIDPAELSPGEFAHIVRQCVETGQTRLVIIDSLNGYLNAMPEERFLVLQMHELLSYLGQLGVVTILVLAQHGAGRADADAGGHQLSQRRGADAALFRGRRPRATRHLRRQEAQRRRTRTRSASSSLGQVASGSARRSRSSRAFWAAFPSIPAAAGPSSAMTAMAV